jgi:hypothetical protein
VVLPANVGFVITDFNPQTPMSDREPGEGPRFNQYVQRQTAPLSDAARAFRQVYTELARETGGLAVSITPNGDLPTSFRQALQEFRDSYVLHFVPTAVDSGGVHQLTIRVKRDDVDVRARRSYVRK